MKLKNKIAVITGASRGIGLAVAEAYVQEGAKVAVCGSRLETAEKAVAHLHEKYPKAALLPLGANVSDGAAVQTMFDAVIAHWGGLDILVNNAGITAAKSIFDMTDEDFETLLRVDLTGPFTCTREAAVIMKKQGGCIINTSSVIGVYGGKMQTAYAAAKAGLIGLTKACAKELGPYGIRVNAVAPGVVSTDMVAQTVTPQTLSGLKSLTPLGRTAHPEELAGAYVYLASEAASFTTGAILQVDGGLVM